MSNNIVNVKIELLEVKLMEVHFNFIDAKQDSNEVERKNSIEDYSYDKENNFLYVQVKDTVTGPFNFEIIVRGIYEVLSDAEFSESEIGTVFDEIEQKNKLTYPLFAESALIIGQLSGKSLGIPLIVKPQLENTTNNK
ncbi:hypothetical protein [Bacillus altitudinis]|uniref:hypothetical protein n=1 Tax=Bacillus altitudinis TaxID=293387 RepID=UPI00203A788C|nr:hypothetical protein [Bacillus altitudinis]MCM3046645.1 hypothetical protein [Bacillus altitudinis]MEC1805179.1 hypothetical protein [Bacillus altitudinis]